MPPQENTLPPSQTPPPVVPPAASSPTENPLGRFLENKTRLYMILGGILVLAIVLGGWFVLSGKKPSQNQKPIAAPLSDMVAEYSPKQNGTFYTSAISPALKNPPKTDFKYTSTAPNPRTIAQAPSLKLIHDIGEFEAMELAKKLGIAAKPSLIGVGNFHFYDPDQKIDLVVYRKSAAFVATFLNSINQATPSASQVKILTDADAISQATAYLKGLSLWEDSFSAPMGSPFPKNGVVYKRASQPNNYFVEFHRGWSVLPILNEVGLLNSPLKDQLVDPKKYLAVDQDISYASDGLNSFQRPDQFNTLTVGLNKSGQVTYLQYYLRKISDQTPSTIKPYDQALNELKSGNGLGVLVYPIAQRAGSNEADYTQDQWQQLFPQGNTRSDEAVIDDAQLAYEEKLVTEPQSIMIPVYLFRGKAPLKGGVVINFVALVDARSQ